MKKGARILGIDDAAFSFQDSETELVGVVYRGTEFIEDIRTRGIEVDGEDATGAVIELHNSMKNPRQIKAVLVDGISLAGFNIVDIHAVAEELEKPVIAVTSNRPDRQSFRETMERTGNQDGRFEKFDDPERIELEDGTAYIQYSGTGVEEAREIIRSSIIHGLTPEPVRVAHLIGRSDN